MKAYVIEQSNNEIKKVYGLLIEKINQHVKLLAENSKPFTSFMGIKRGLLRLKIGYMDTSNTSTSSVHGSAQNKDVMLDGEEELLANEIFETMNIDVKQAVDTGLIGIREMKRQLVRHYYEQMAKEGKKYKDIKVELSKRYGLSVSSIEKLVYRKNPSTAKAASPLGGESLPAHIIKNDNDG